MFLDLLVHVASVAPLLAVALVIHTLLHEAAHALAARAVGFRVLGIQWSVVVPGIVITDDQPDNVPGDRLRWAIVHLAGVAANLLLVLTAAHLAAVSLLAAFDAMFLPGASLLVALAGVGLIVVVVNLVPAPFMDGGRTILALTTGHAGPRLRAVQTALWAVTVAIILTATATVAARF